MLHRWFALSAILVAASLSGCMAIHNGPGCVDSCAQCDDCCPPPIPCNPWEGMCQMCRSTVCSGGCGEVYYGEWYNNPPDCVDPCDECQVWNGGCGEKCFPCVRIFSFLSCLHGKRLRCDDTPDVFDICRICNHACCEEGCDTCPSCCGDEEYIDEGSILYDDGMSMTEGSSTSVAAGRMVDSEFRPMPRARLASSSNVRSSGTTKAPCNCGKQH
jgi:hypothetical protein